MKILHDLKFPLWGLLLSAALFVCEGASYAQDLMPAGAETAVEAGGMSGQETHPPLRLTPDKSQIIDLDEPVDRVVVASTVHINILLDSTRRLIVVPRAPGATHFTLLSREGKVIMQRHVVVASPQQKYVRVRQPCFGTEACMPIRMYYCPGMCHEMAIVGEDDASYSGSIAAAPLDSGGSSSSSTGGSSLSQTGSTSQTTTTTQDQ